MVKTDFSATLSTSPPVYVTYDSDTDVSFELNTGTYQQASALTATGITQPVVGPLPKKGSLHVPILRRGDLSEGVDNRDERDYDETSFTHTIDTVSRDQKDKTKILSYGLERKLHQTTITREFEDVPAGDVVRFACEQAGVDPLPGGPFPSPDSVSDPDVARILRADAADDSNRVSAEYKSVPAISVIDGVCRAQAWEWRITNSILWFGEQAAANGQQPGPDDSRERRIALQTAPRTYQLRWIKPDNTDPGVEEYPFDIVRVVGKPTRITSSGAPQPINDPTVAEIKVGPKQRSINGTPRVHVYKDDRIRKQGHANKTARQMWKELERQSQSGPITVVGDPRPEPLDRVVMPDWAGGTNHLVDSILHTITRDEGFVTEIRTAGQPDLSQLPEIKTEPTTPATIVSGDGDGGDGDDGGSSEDT